MSLNKYFFSICIPIWGANGKGIEYLDYNLNSINNQNFKDFEVVISDHSVDKSLEDYINNWNSILNINYIKCEIGRGSIAPNINNAIKNSIGQYIKILYQDDFLYDEYSLENIANYIKEKDINWLVTGCAHTIDMETMYDCMIPRYNDNIHLGINTISCPSVLTIKNDENKLYLDESLKFLDDVEYYKRYYNKFGLPDILPSICTINREGGVRATSMLNQKTKQKEIDIMIKKYGNFK